MHPWGFATLPGHLESLDGLRCDDYSTPIPSGEEGHAPQQAPFKLSPIEDYCCSLYRNHVSLFVLFFI